MTTIEVPEVECPEDFGRLEWKALPTGETSSPLTGVIGHDDTEGTVTALIAVSGVSDKVGDVIVPGSLAVAVARLKPKGVLDHNWGQTVSKLVFAEELMPGDPRLPKTTPNGDPWPVNAGGLLIKAKYNLDKQLGRDAYADAKFYGPELCFSIGYKVRPGGARMRGGKRHLHNYDIYEYSHVLHGAHELATLVGVKSLTDGFEWYPGGRSGPSDEGTIEVKALPGRRIVRNAEFWGLPVGTPIRSGMRPRSTDRPATPEEIAATTAPAADAHPVGNTGATPGGLPETPSETPGAPKPAASGQPGKLSDVVAPALPAPPAPNVTTALAVLHARYQKFAALQHDQADESVSAHAVAGMTMLAQFATPGADVHASPDGQLAAVHGQNGWVIVDIANAGTLPVPIGDFPPEQIDNALAELEQLDIPWDDPAARKKRWADPAAKEQDRQAVREVLSQLTPFDVAGLGNDGQMARRDAEDAITAGDRNDLADALERMGLPPDQDPHDVAATLLVLPTEVVGKRLDAIEAAAAPPTASMADQAGIPTAPADTQIRYAAARTAAGVPDDHSDIAPIPGTAIGPPKVPTLKPKPKSTYKPLGNMSTAHTLDEEQLQAEHDHAVERHMQARRNGLPRNSVEFTDSRTAMRIFGDEQRRRGAAKAQADAETPLPPDAGAPNMAALRAMPHEEFQRVMAGMPPEARKEVLAKLGVDEVESLLEPSFLGGDAAYREQVTDRLHEIDPTRAAAPRRAHRDLIKKEDAAKSAAEAAKSDTPKAPESAPDVTYDAHGVSEGPDGELQLDEETYARQDRVLALIAAGDAALKTKSNDELTSDRKDLVGELGLQDEIADRGASLREGAAAPTRTVPSDTPAGAADDGADSVDQPAQPAASKLRPGLAGAAEDLGGALNATPRDEEAIAVAAERFAKLVRRAPADSKAFIELQKVIGENIHVAIARGDLKAGMLFTAVAALREERRNTRNAAARERRKARRIDRDRIKALIGSIDAELRSRKTGATLAVYQRHQATEGKGLPVPDMVIPAAVLERASEIKKAAPPDVTDDEDESFEDVVGHDDRYVMDAGGLLLKAIPCQNCGNTTQYPVGAGPDTRKCLMCGATLQMQPTPATVG